MDQLTYKNYFLRTLIGALSVSALIGIFIFLAGDFGDTETRLLLTTLTITGFSLTGLCSSTVFNRSSLKEFSTLGMIISVLGCLITIAAIWEIIFIDNAWKPVIIFIIISFSLGHISLLLLIKPKTDTVKYCMNGTIIFIAIVTLMLIHATLDEFGPGDLFYRLIGVFAILDVLGTITTPIANKIAE
jgi:hypothetical protein